MRTTQCRTCAREPGRYDDYRIVACAHFLKWSVQLVEWHDGLGERWTVDGPRPADVDVADVVLGSEGAWRRWRDYSTQQEAEHAFGVASEALRMVAV